MNIFYGQNEEYLTLKQPVGTYNNYDVIQTDVYFLMWLNPVIYTTALYSRERETEIYPS
jgi:hypothetical protein